MLALKNILVTLLALPILLGCNYDEMLKKFTPAEESALAQRYIDQLRLKNFSEIKKNLSPEIATPNIDEELTKVASYFPPGSPLESKIIGANTFKSNEKFQAALTYQYRFNDGWAVASITLEKSGNSSPRIKSLHVYRNSAPLEEINKLTFQGKSWKHYLFAAMSALAFGVIVYALIVCIKTPIKGKKWLWIIFILLGLGGFNLNWTTGETSTWLASINLFGVGIRAASPYSPWILTFSLPVGALVFLIRWKNLVKPAGDDLPLESAG